MTTYPEKDESHRDLGRFVDSAYRNEDGSIKHTELYFSAHAIRSDAVGQVAAHHREILNMLSRLYREMPPSIVSTLEPQLHGMAKVVEAAVAGKNSETVYKVDGKPQSMSSLRQDMAKISTEHIYNSNDEAKDGMWANFFGTKKQENRE